MNTDQKTGFMYVFLCIFFTVIGQLLIKYGMKQMGAVPIEAGKATGYILRAVFHPANITGLVFAAFAAFSWMGALSRTDLSVAYPFMGLAIALVLALTPICFGERVSPAQWIGVAFVCLGLWIASRGR